MRNRHINYYFTFIIFIAATKLNGQTIPPKIINYANGNSLTEKGGNYELKSKDDKILGIWNIIGSIVEIKNKKYSKIFKIEGTIKKEGLFNSQNGILIIQPIYDALTPLTDNNGVIFIKIGQKIGLANSEEQSILNPIYEGFYNYSNGKYLLKKEKIGFVINEKLQIIDSILEFKTLQKIYYPKDKKYFEAVYLTEGISIFDSENKLIEFNKDWTKIHEEFSGDNLIISTKDGYGLFNVKTRKVCEPYLNRTFVTKPFYNEQILFAEKNKWKLFDSSGKKLLEIVADSIIPTIDGEWSGFFFKQKGLWGFVDVYGKILQKPIWKSMWNPRLDNFKGTLSNGKAINYYYEYKHVDGKQIITKVSSGESMTAPPN